MSLRPIKRLVRSKPTIEGAGVHLRRAFGFGNTSDFDPFQLLDDFRNDVPEDYLAGFPWHPHRGIETITYVLAGTVEHGDSMGNHGAIAAGDVQWMTAGSGIIHQEMPQRTEGTMSGFQLWVNLPAKEKMSTPAYRGLTARDIPEATTDDGARVKVVAGTFNHIEGPVRGIPVDPTYLDVRVPPGGEFELPTHAGYNVFGHAIEGSGTFAGSDASPVGSGETVLFGAGGALRARASEDGFRFLAVSGRPLHEPVAWYGPIVMNTRSELLSAVRELQSGDFIKHRRPILEE